MHIVPVKYRREGSPRELPLDDATVNFDGDLVFAVLGVKMWWRVVAVLHPYYDAKESTDLWHSTRTYYRLKKTN